MDTSKSSTINPWFSIWFHPRTTIQKIVERNQKHMVLVLAILTGFSQNLDRAVQSTMIQNFGWPLIVGVAAALGPITGLIGLNLSAALFRWTGRWIGGQATMNDLRAAIAWSNLPVVASLVLWVPKLELFGQDIFLSEEMQSATTLSLIPFFDAADAFAGLWSFVLALHCVGQVQGFSAWKALVNFLLSFAIIAIPVGVVVLAAVASL